MHKAMPREQAREKEGKETHDTDQPKNQFRQAQNVLAEFNLAVQVCHKGAKKAESTKGHEAPLLR